MADQTPNLDLPYLMGSQAQKHVTHNEALRMLDALVQLAVVSRSVTAPPGIPADGERYIVPAGATGAFAGHGDDIAAFMDGAWFFFTPQTGWLAHVVDDSALYVYDGSAWVSASAVPSALNDLTRLGLGTAADAANPFAAKLNAALWTALTAGEGGSGDLRFTFNKETAADTGSLVFQTGYSGRAEIGLAGNDDLSISVSPDGSTFYSAMAIDKDTGNVAIGTSSDGTNRLLVSGANNLFTSAGNLSFTFNKGAAANDCSLTFQDNFSARALVGLLGDDDFTFKVSADGSSYKTGMVIQRTTGKVSFSEHPKFSCYLNFGQDYTQGAWRDLLMNNTRHNDQGDVSIASNVATFTAPHDGYYLFGVGATYEAGSAPTKMQVGLSVNNATPNFDAITSTGDATLVSGETAINVTALIKLTAGQTVKPKINFATNNGRVLANENFFWGCQIA